LTSPLRPSSGTHEIMRITLLVQNGTVHSMNSRLHARRAHMEGQEIRHREADDQRDAPHQQAELQRADR
jgi:hypothetical protein